MARDVLAWHIAWVAGGSVERVSYIVEDRDVFGVYL